MRGLLITIALATLLSGCFTPPDWIPALEAQREEIAAVRVELVTATDEERAVLEATLAKLVAENKGLESRASEAARSDVYAMLLEIGGYVGGAFGLAGAGTGAAIWRRSVIARRPQPPTATAA